MSNITIEFKTGEIKHFPHTGRAGGSYTKHLYYEGAFVIVEDEWGTRTAFPAADIAQVREDPNRMFP